MTKTYDPPRIYAACLAAYNSGRLHGAWIDCEGKSGDELRVEIDDMLARSPEPNVTRRKCPACGHWQTDARPYALNAEGCPSCGDEAIDALEFRPSAEEWAIHDHEGFCGLVESEWPNLDELAELAEVLAEDDEAKRRGLLWLVNDRGYKLAEAIARCDEVQTYESNATDLAADYAQELAADTIENFDERAGQWPFNCIDWQEAGRALTMGGDVDLYEDAGERFLVTNAAEF